MKNYHIAQNHSPDMMRRHSKLNRADRRLQNHIASHLTYATEFLIDGRHFPERRMWPSAVKKNEDTIFNIDRESGSPAGPGMNSSSKREPLEISVSCSPDYAFHESAV
jgi:hypothetical protein